MLVPDLHEVVLNHLKRPVTMSDIMKQLLPSMLMSNVYLLSIFLKVFNHLIQFIPIKHDVSCEVDETVI